MVAAHIPLQHTSIAQNAATSAAAFFSAGGEGLEARRWESCAGPSCHTLGEWQADMWSQIESLLLRYGVSLFLDHLN